MLPHFQKAIRHIAVNSTIYPKIIAFSSLTCYNVIIENNYIIISIPSVFYESPQVQAA